MRHPTSIAGVWLSAVVLQACVSPPPHAVLRVEDPSGYAAEATALEIGRTEGKMTSVSLDSETFPVTVSISGLAEGREYFIWVDAVRSGDAVARGGVWARIPRGGRSQTFVVELHAACSEASHGEPCTFDREPETPAVCLGATCTRSTCGDGVVDERTGESCDDGNGILTDECPDGAAGSCRDASGDVIDSCGDGFIREGVEECDDGNLDNDDYCKADCTVNVCGDGFQNAAVLPSGEPVEECDDGPLPPGDLDPNDDGCLANCRLARCGDGFVDRTPRNDGTGQPMEACDDGPDDPPTARWLNPNDGCNRQCERTEWESRTRLGFGDNVGLPTLNNAVASTLALRSVQGTAWGPGGEIYVTDADALRVWRLTDVSADNDPEDWRVTVAIGRGSTFISRVQRNIGDGIPAPLAALREPAGIAVDGNGNLYLADRGVPASSPSDIAGHRIRRVDALTQIVTTVAGTGAPDYAGDGGPAAAASLDDPTSVAIDGQGNLYVADSGNGVVRRIDGTTGLIETWVGSGACGAPTDGQDRLAVPLCEPRGVAVDPDGRLVVSDVDDRGGSPTEGCTILRIEPDGASTLLAGNNGCGYAGDGAAASSASFSAPWGLAFSDDGDLYVADANNNRVRRIVAQGGAVSPSSIVELVAGTGQAGTGGDGGVPTLAALDTPRAVAVAEDGTLVIGDQGARVRRIVAADGSRIDPSGDVIDTLAGDVANGVLDGREATELPIQAPAGVDFYVDASAGRYLYVVDRSWHRVVEVDANGLARIVAGSGGYQWFNGAFAGDNGPATTARLNQPLDVVADAQDNLYVADTGNHRVRRVDRATGTITTYAGSGEVEDTSVGELLITAGQVPNPIPTYTGFAGDGGPAAAAKLTFPTALDIGPDDNLYIVDYRNRRIRRVDSTTGDIETVAGDGNGLWNYGGGVETATATSLGSVADIAFGPDGYLYAASYVVDSSGPRAVRALWKIDADADTIELFGEFVPPSSLPFDTWFEGLAVDATGALIFSSGQAHPKVPRPLPGQQMELLWRWAPSDGVPSVIAGNDSRSALIGDGGPAELAFFQSAGRVAVDALGNIAMAEAGGIRRVRYIDASSGVIFSMVGWLWPGDGDFQAGGSNYAELGSPRSLAFVPLLRNWLVTDANGNPFASPNNGTVRRVDTSNARVDTVAGYLLGNNNIYPVGPPRYARGLKDGGGIVVDPLGDRVFVSEPGFNTLYTLTFANPNDVDSWSLDRYSGEGSNVGGYADGALLDARFNRPRGLAYDADTEILYLADTGNHVLRAIDTAAGSVSTFAGTPRVRGFDGDGGPAVQALFNAPEAVEVLSVDGVSGPETWIYVGDTGNHRVRRIAPDGTVTTVVGTGVANSIGTGQPASDYPAESPRGMAIDGFGNLLFTSLRTVRAVGAGDDGVPGPEDRVYPIYGGDPAAITSPTSPRCLNDLAIDPTVGGSAVLYVLDACQGYFFELHRVATLEAGGTGE